MPGKRWLLPNGIEDLLPDSAEALDGARRRLLDLMSSWGYRLIEPPLIEFEESLLTYADVQSHAFKVIDPYTAKTMAIRPDITPQAARIDAHLIEGNGANRLCYIGSVLSAKSSNMSVSRNPKQLGAELFGVSDISGDIEVLCLMVALLSVVGLERIHLDLGHVGIFRGLAKQASLAADEERRLFDAVQSKSNPTVASLLAQSEMSAELKKCFTGLPNLHGAEDVLERATELFHDTGDEVQQALADLRTVAEQVKSFLPGMPLYFDLSELHGYHYHTGFVFAAYTAGSGRAIARGGRYDGIGSDFGRSRPATGFSADLKMLLELSNQESKSCRVVAAPWDSDVALQTKINELRQQGVSVVYEHVVDELPLGNLLGRLTLEDGSWLVVENESE